MFYVITRRATPDVAISLLFIRYEINPHSWLFLLAARQSVQAPSALAPQRRFPQSLRSFGMTVVITPLNYSHIILQIYVKTRNFRTLVSTFSLTGTKKLPTRRVRSLEYNHLKITSGSMLREPL